MSAEQYPKPALTSERAERLAQDGLRMKRELEERKNWLILEKGKTHSSDKKGILDAEIGKIAAVLEKLRVSEPTFTEDDAVQFLHEASQLLGHTEYAHTADVHPFKSKEK